MCKEGDLHRQEILSDMVILFCFACKINITTELSISLPFPKGRCKQAFSVTSQFLNPNKVQRFFFVVNVH